MPFVAITLLAGLQTISPSLYEAAAIDGATPWQRFRHVTLPLLTPIIAVVMTFSVLFTFTDFQLIYVITRGGPLNATHLMATLVFQRAIPGGALGEGAAIATAMVPFLLAAILFSYFGLQRRAWQQGGAATSEPRARSDRRAPQARRDAGGMDYLESLPRRVVTVYLPLVVFLIVLLFPFYWMAITRSSRTPSCSRARATRSACWPDPRPLPQAALRDVVSGLAVEHGADLGGIDGREANDDSGVGERSCGCCRWRLGKRRARRPHIRRSIPPTIASSTVEPHLCRRSYRPGPTWRESCRLALPHATRTTPARSPLP